MAADYNYGQMVSSWVKKIPIVSTVFGSGNEHIILSPEESHGILVCANYMQEIPTPDNQAFVTKFKAKYGANAPLSATLLWGIRECCCGRRE